MTMQPVPGHADVVIRGLRTSLKGVVVDCGEADAGTVAANSTKDVDVTFNYTFLEPPIVVAVLQLSATEGVLAEVGVSLRAPGWTRTGCKLRFYNNTGSGQTPDAFWVAIGIV